MNRLAIVLFLVALTGTASAGQQNGQQLITNYRKGYQLLGQKQKAGLDRIRSAHTLSERGGHYGNATMFKLMSGATSREQLVAEKRAEIVEAQQKVAQERQDWRQNRLGARIGRGWRKLLGKSVAIEPAKADEAAVNKELAAFEKELDRAEKVVGEIDQVLRTLPGKQARAIDLSKPYGNALLADHKALGAELAKLADHYAAVLPNKSIGKFEALLMSRITKQVVEERPAFLAHLATAEPEALHAEALDLIQEIRELSHAETMRSETTLTGSGESASVSASSTKVLGGLAYSKQSGSASYSHWNLEGKTLLPEGSDYTIALRSSSLPLRKDKWSSQAQETTGMLPVEARILLEKALKVSEIFEALGKRAPGLASNIAPWVTQSRFVLQVPRGEGGYGDAYRQHKGVHLPENILYDNAIVSMTRPKADLLKLAGSGLVDAERAAMFKTELDKKLVGGLK